MWISCEFAVEVDYRFRKRLRLVSIHLNLEAWINALVPFVLQIGGHASLAMRERL